MHPAGTRCNALLRQQHRRIEPDPQVAPMAAVEEERDVDLGHDFPGIAQVGLEQEALGVARCAQADGVVEDSLVAAYRQIDGAVTGRWFGYPAVVHRAITLGVDDE